METLVGFAVGFWLGTKEGKEGLARLMSSVEAIRGKVDTKAIVGDALNAIVPIVREIAAAGGPKAAAAHRAVAKAA